MTVPSITQTGVTFAAVSEQPAAAGSNTGGADGSYDGGFRQATAGTSSAAGVVTGTLSTSETGAAWMTRLRVFSTVPPDQRFKKQYPQLLAHAVPYTPRRRFTFLDGLWRPDRRLALA